jgi:hypothetical protein
MDEPDNATNELFAKFTEISSRLPPESVNLLHTIVKIAGDIQESGPTTDPVAFEAEFDAAFTPYPKSKADLMREYASVQPVREESANSIIRSSAAPGSIINSLASPPMVIRTAPDESDDSADHD